MSGGPTNYREENSDKVHSTEGGELSGQMSDLRTRDVVAKMRSNFVSVDSIRFEHFRHFCLFFNQFVQIMSNIAGGHVLSCFQRWR